MVAFFAESRLELEVLIRKAAELDALVLDPSAVGSEEELELAHHLTKKSFEKKNALAKKLKYEFLLWLTGKTDIRSAFKKSGPKDAKDLFVVVFKEEKSHVLKALEAKERKRQLKKHADALRLEEISLSRIKN